MRAFLTSSWLRRLPAWRGVVAVDEEVHERGLEHAGVDIVEDVLHHRVVRVGGVEARLADGAALALELPGAERVRSVEELRQVLDRVSVEVVNGLLQPCHDGEASAIRNFSEKHIEIRYVF